MPEEPVPSQLPRGSQETRQVRCALLDARRKFGKVGRRSTAFTGQGDEREFYSYADLAAYLDAVDGPLMEAGLLLSQEIWMMQGSGTCFMQTRVDHVASGEWIASYLPMVAPTDRDPHVSGSRMTYARRHALGMTLGIAARHDDDDGGTASQSARTEKANRKTRSAATEKAPPPETAVSTAPPAPSPSERLASLYADLAKGFAAGGTPAADEVWLAQSDFLKSLSGPLFDVAFDRFEGIVGTPPPEVERDNAA